MMYSRDIGQNTFDAISAELTSVKHPPTAPNVIVGRHKYYKLTILIRTVGGSLEALVEQPAMLDKALAASASTAEGAVLTRAMRAGRAVRMAPSGGGDTVPD